MNTDNEARPNDDVVSAYVAAQNAVMEASKLTQLLLELCRQQRELKAISAVTGMAHKLEKLELDFIKHGDAVLAPVGE